MKSNVDESICYPQPQTLVQRVAIANDFMQETADLAYGAWPERIYIIDESGVIMYRGGLGPFNYHPEEARAWLEKRFAAVHAFAAGNRAAN